MKKKKLVENKIKREMKQEESHRFHPATLGKGN